MSDNPNIYQRINAVMKAVKFVQKDASVSGYMAVTHDQVVSVARTELVKAGVVIYPKQTGGVIEVQREPEKGIKMHLYSGWYDVHFVNMDSPEDRMTVTVNAHAADNGDKAPGKCLTYATKAAILKALCLETGENDESREDYRERVASINDEQMDQLIAAIGASGMTLSEFCAHKKVNIPNIAAFPAQRLTGALKWLDGMRGKKNDSH